MTFLFLSPLLFWLDWLSCQTFAGERQEEARSSRSGRSAPFMSLPLELVTGSLVISAYIDIISRSLSIRNASIIATIYEGGRSNVVGHRPSGRVWLGRRRHDGFMTAHNIVWLVKHAVSYSQRHPPPLSPSIESDSGEPRTRSNSLLCTFKFNNQTNIDTAKEGAVSAAAPPPPSAKVIK